MGCHDEVHDEGRYWGDKLGIDGVSHQHGTVRFGVDPGTSALDVDCRAHDVDNPSVADSSFFPSSNATNPTLTTIANALPVADTIATRLG